MNAKTLFAGTSIALALAAAAATPAHATLQTFAEFSAIGLDNLYYRGTTGATLTPPATFYSIPTATGKVAGPVDVKFSFINEGSYLDSAVSSVIAVLTLSGSVTGPITVDPATHNYEEPTSATFTFKSTAPITVGHVTYPTGSILLSGTWGNAFIVGKSNTASLNSDNTAAFGDTLTFSSDFVTFHSNSSLDANLGLNSVLPALAKAGSYSLKSFHADVDGQFGSDPAPQVNAVPEPASWAMMMVGFGLAGASIRRRTRAQAAA